MLGDPCRRLALLTGVRGAIQRKGYSQDLKAIAESSEEDYMVAQNIAKKRETLSSGAGRRDMPQRVRTALQTLLLSTANVPGTEGRKTSLRHEMHAANLFFGPATFFCTPNHADTYSPLMCLLHQGPDRHDHTGESTNADILKACPQMPPLERMHQIAASNPRAQAKFYLLMQELHFSHIQGLEKLSIGRQVLIKPTMGKGAHDSYASRLQPAITPAAADVCAPGEAQGRGFQHAHAKGHSRVGVTVSWLRKVLKQSTAYCREQVQALRVALLSAASSVQYESANEPGAQLGVSDLPPEPFTFLQQKQSKMDGKVEDDGTRRDDVPVSPSLRQEHLEREA